METIAGWIAPCATMIAAIMTASNLGARVTGWGFVVFSIGSIGWVAVAIASGQQNLLWTNGFLTIVNALGVWRWLGRQARYEDGSKAAEAKSAARRAPTLFSAASLPGRKVIGPDGEPLGVLVDGMIRCTDGRLAYIVLRTGGVAGLGERLHALKPQQVSFTEDGVTCGLDADAVARMPEVEPTAWPEKAP